MAWAPRLSPKQREAYESTLRFILATGPRACGKTWGFEHRVMRHLWRNQARFGLISKTTRSGTLGIWSELTGIIFNEWKEAGVCTEDCSFGWVKEPTVDPTTKINRALIRNRFGGASELILFPIERAADAMDKLFSTQFSGLWISEGHLYDSRKLYDVAKGQLRLAGVPFSETGLIVDCNPPDEAEDSWLYDVFVREPNLPEAEFNPDWNPKTRAAFKEMQRQTGVFRFTLDDNIYLDPGLADQIRSTYASDPIAYRRFVLGEWVKTSTILSLFAASFKKQIHVVGTVEGPEDRWEVMVPSDAMNVDRIGGQPVLTGGWDLGTANHAWVAVQKYYRDDGRPAFYVLDELIYVHSKVTIERFTEEVLERRKVLAADLPNGCRWVDYSDDSAMRFRATIRRDESGIGTAEEDHVDAGIVEDTSDGEITLIGATAVKRRGWQRRRCDMVEQLLREGRLLVSAHCTKVIDMFEKLRGTGNEKSDWIAPDQEQKHPFDALSYAISMQLLDELNSPGPATKKYEFSTTGRR